MPPPLDAAAEVQLLRQRRRRILRKRALEHRGFIGQEGHLVAGLLETTSEFESLVKTFLTLGHWEKAILSYHAFLRRGNRPSVRGCHLILQTCSKQWAQAAALLRDMGARGLRPDARSYNYLASACGAANLWALPLELLPLAAVASSEEEEEEDEDEARALASHDDGFEEEDTGVITDFATIACTLCKQWERAVLLMKAHLLECSVEASEVTLSSAIAAAGREGHWQMSLAALKLIQRSRAAVTLKVYRSVVAACGGAARWRPALALMERMWRELIPPDEDTYSSLGIALQKSSCWERLFDLLDEMRLRRIYSNVVASAAISSTASASKWREALGLLEMAQREAEPDAAVFTAALATAGIGNQPRLVGRILRSMRGAQLEATAVTYTSAIRQLRRSFWRDSIQLLIEMPQLALAATDDTCAAGLSALTFAADRVAGRLVGAWRRCLQFLKDMQRQALRPGLVQFNRALATEMKEKCWEQVCRALEGLRARGLRPSRHSAAAGLEACARGSLWPSALRLAADYGGGAGPLDPSLYNAAMAACNRCGQWELAVYCVQEMQRGA